MKLYSSAHKKRKTETDVKLQSNKCKKSNTHLSAAATAVEKLKHQSWKCCGNKLRIASLHFAKYFAAQTQKNVASNDCTQSKLLKYSSAHDFS